MVVNKVANHNFGKMLIDPGFGKMLIDPGLNINNSWINLHTAPA
jgi:hypothetical protein